MARPDLPPLHLAQFAVAAALVALEARHEATLDQPIHLLRRTLSLLAEADPTLPDITSGEAGFHPKA